MSVSSIFFENKYLPSKMFTSQKSLILSLNTLVEQIHTYSLRNTVELYFLITLSKLFQN